MEISEVISGIKERLRRPERSENSYLFPVPYGAQTKKADSHPPEKTHEGPFNGAIDIFVPEKTPVIASADGEVIEVEDSNEKYGPTDEYRKYLNFITVKSANHEYFQVAHLTKGSAKVRVGDIVTAGQPIAETGLSGQMSEPHLHFFVFRRAIAISNFLGLKPKFK